MHGPLPFLAIDTVTSGPAVEFVVLVLLHNCFTCNPFQLTRNIVKELIDQILLLLCPLYMTAVKTCSTAIIIVQCLQKSHESQFFCRTIDVLFYSVALVKFQV